MVADAICQQFIDGVWRAPLQNVEINTGVKNQRAADKRFVGCPGKLGILLVASTALNACAASTSARLPEIKWQHQYLPGHFPCAGQGGHRNHLRAPDATMRAPEVRYPKYVSPLLCRFDEACRHPAGQALFLASPSNPTARAWSDTSRLRFSAICSSASIGVRVAQPWQTSIC